MADIAQEKEKLREDFRQLVSDAQGLLEATKENLDDRTKEARARLAQSLDEAKSRYHRLEDRVAEEVRRADEVIRDRPYHAMGASFILGLVLGLVTGRK